MTVFLDEIIDTMTVEEKQVENPQVRKQGSEGNLHGGGFDVVYAEKSCGFLFAAGNFYCSFFLFESFFLEA